MPSTQAFIAPRQALIRPTSTAMSGIKGFRAWFESQFPDAINGIDKDTAHDTFDHVLIDMNQLLHIAMRRALNDGHALAMLMKELDACVELATPTKSLVLAMDGPPSAAKLATQRRRRFGTLVKSGWKQKQLSRFRKTLSKKQELTLRRRYESEVKTLCITPGTDFMTLAEHCLLYWAWQRLSNPRHALANVKIYISSSDVPGEGEIKLLEWILQKNRNGESIAIMGGDSDLVLEGLVIPPASSHNVFVLLPDGSSRYLAVSLWETTRALSHLLPGLQAKDVMRVRTDLVVLLILNGNDYLPKLRGSAGFNKIFHTYLKLVHHWLTDPKITDPPFLIDPDSLNFNLPFCIAFFKRLIPERQNLHDAETIKKNGQQTITALGYLNNLVESAFMPKPMIWSLIDDEDHTLSLQGEDEIEDDDMEVDEAETDYDENEDDMEEDVEGENIMTLRLSFGKAGTDEYYVYEKRHNSKRKLKYTKNLLAGLALEDLMGADYASDLTRDEESSGISNSGYAWEIQHPLDGKVETYLQGIIWNLQTYQDGVCVDYGYNYGKRMSPLSDEIVDYFRAAMEEGRDVGRNSLLPDKFESSICSSVSCLAALPSQIQELIPEPYRKLSNTTVEEIYASCMDPHDNVFYMKEFERLINDEVKKMGFSVQPTDDSNTGVPEVKIADDAPTGRGRRILCSDHAWTVLSKSSVPLNHPFEPPVPLSNRFSELKSNSRIRVGRSIAATGPRERTVWPRKPAKDTHTSTFITKHDEPPEWTHGDIGDLLVSFDVLDKSIFNVKYKYGYRKLVPSKSFQEMEQRTPAMIALGFKSAPQLASGQEKKPHERNKFEGPKSSVTERSDVITFGDSLLQPLTPGLKADARLESMNEGAQKASKKVTKDSEEFTIPNSVLGQLDPGFLPAPNLKNGKEKPPKKSKKVPDQNSSAAERNAEKCDDPKNELKIETTERSDGATSTSGSRFENGQAAKTKKPDKIGNQIDIRKRMVQFKIIEPPQDPLRNLEDHTASMLLNQMEQAKMLSFKWDSITPSPTEFASFNPKRHECIRLNVKAGKMPLSISLGEAGRKYEQDREVFNQSKTLLKLHIASMALQDLLGPGKRWPSMTFAEMKAKMMRHQDDVNA
jgi:hypothetical protein